MAIPPGQLALEPGVHVLQQHRRPLRPRLEPDHGRALAHYVNRAARLGAWVLISEIWYYSGQRPIV